MPATVTWGSINIEVIFPTGSLNWETKFSSLLRSDKIHWHFPKCATVRACWSQGLEISPKLQPDNGSELPPRNKETLYVSLLVHPSIYSKAHRCQSSICSLCSASEGLTSMLGRIPPQHEGKDFPFWLSPRCCGYLWWFSWNSRMLLSWWAALFKQAKFATAFFTSFLMIRKQSQGLQHTHGEEG